MKLIFATLFLFSFAAQASPILSMKERLRLNLWVYGLEDQPSEKKKEQPQKQLPEELERALRKL